MSSNTTINNNIINIPANQYYQQPAAGSAGAISVTGTGPYVGQTIHTCGNTNCNCPDIHVQSILSQLGGTPWFTSQPLTPEELEELKRLSEDHERETKLNKIEEFKKIEPELRQRVIDYVLIKQEAKRVKNTTIEKSKRLLELEQKRDSGNLTYAISGSYSSDMYNFELPDYIIAIFGLSEEEMIEAHKKACAEEALTSIE